MRKTFFIEKPPPKATSDRQSQSHTKVSSNIPAILTAFMEYAKLILFSHSDNHFFFIFVSDCFKVRVYKGQPPPWRAL